MSYGQSKSNNPFAPAPQLHVQHTAVRFPDVNQDPAYQYAQNERAQEEQYQQYQQQQLNQQQQNQQNQYDGGLSQPSYSQPFLQTSQTGFNPTSSFGQHLSAQMTGMPQQQQPNGGYSPALSAGGTYIQQVGGGQSFGFGPGSGGYQSPPPVSDLDPYASLDGLLNSGIGPSSFPGGGGSSQQSGQTGSSGLSHPRQYVQEQKGLLMQFDSYAWKQLINRVDGLRESWEARKAALVDAGRKGADPTQIEGLRKQAEIHVDTIHAAKFQLSEVQSGWQHSTDLASKSRVREALNAGLSSLPDFPASLAPEHLGGVFGQRAIEDFRKQSILSGYAAPQQQQQQQMIPAQPTGYGGYRQQGYQQPQQTGFGGMQPQTGFYGSQFGGQQGQYYS